MRGMKVGVARGRQTEALSWVGLGRCSKQTPPDTQLESGGYP